MIIFALLLVLILILVGGALVFVYNGSLAPNSQGSNTATTATAPTATTVESGTPVVVPTVNVPAPTVNVPAPTVNVPAPTVTAPIPVSKAPEPVTMHISGCEADSAAMTCSSGVIKDGHFRYGRWNNSICGHPTVSPSTAAREKTYPISSCIGKSSCTLSSYNSTFGEDIYPNVYKHWEADYTCGQ